MSQATVATPTLERAVFVEACDSGWDPQTVVRHLVWYDGHVHEELKVFSSLRDALVYAQKACASPDGPCSRKIG
ncbi:MAG: hypothetical protein ACRD3V_27045 [Vicinamibacteria bacterium]